jgi:hypothetical protein
MGFSKVRNPAESASMIPHLPERYEALMAMTIENPKVRIVKRFNLIDVFFMFIYLDYKLKEKYKMEY